MSIIDPDAARREREARIPGPRDLVVAAVVALVLPAAAALTLPRMLVNAAEHDVFDGGSVLALVLTFGGAAATILAVIHWAALVARYPRLLGIAAPLGLALIGVGIGLGLTAQPPAWVQPPTLGAGSASALAVGLLLLGAALWIRRSRTRRISREEEIIRATAPVTGVVTNQAYDVPSTEASAILSTVTYAFTDASGTRRFVKRGARVPMKDPILDGEQVDVWFDRTDPADTARIVVRRRPPERR